MAATFDELKNTNNSYSTIHRMTGGGATYSSNYNSSTAFDYFVNSPAVNDCIMFSYCLWTPYQGGMRWHNLKVNVGTAINGSPVGVWEYYKVGGTWATLTCTDPTNGFTITGSKTITFNIPSDWVEVNNSARALYVFPIRYRLTDVTGITEGGANTTDYVQMNDWAIHVTGYTSGTPCNLGDLLTADVAGSWGVVTKIDGNVFILNCSLIIGDGSTASYFADINKILIMHGIIYTYASGEIRFGTISTNGYPRDGCSIQMRDDTNNQSYGWNGSIANAITKLYDTRYNLGTYTNQGGTNNIYKSVQLSNVNSQIYGGTWDRVTFSDCFDGFRVSSTLGVVPPNDIKVGSCYFGMHVGWLTNNTYYDIYNMNFGIDISSNHYRIMSASPTGYWFRMYDPIGYDKTKIGTNTTATNCWIAEYHSIASTIVDRSNLPISGVAISITNSSAETISGTTDANGYLLLYPEVSRVLIATANTIQNKNPLTITISKSGYKKILMTMTHTSKIVQTIKLEKVLDNNFSKVVRVESQ